MFLFDALNGPFGRTKPKKYKQILTIKKKMNMKKLSTIVFALIACVFAAQAQKGEIGVGVGLDVGLPIGNNSDVLGIGIGGTVKGFYGLSDEADLTFTLGYMKFAEKKDYGISYSLVPVLAGYRHKFDQLYVEPQLGFTTLKVKMDFMGMGNIGGSSTKLGYAIGGGYLMGDWDLGLRYQGVSASGGSFSLIAVRVGYNFAL